MLNPKQKLIDFIFSPAIHFFESHHISFLLIWLIPYTGIIIPILKSKRTDTRIKCLKIESVIGFILILIGGIIYQIKLLG